MCDPPAGTEVEWRAEINRALPIPVMADESPRTPPEASRLAGSRAADVFSSKTAKSGGLRATATMASIAAAAGIPCHGGTSIESPVGTAASLHLARASPAVTWGSEPSGPLLLREGLPATPLRHDGGDLHLPVGPGLGVELDPAAVAAFTRR